MDSNARPVHYPLLLELLINILHNGHMTDKWMLRLIQYRMGLAIGIILVLNFLASNKIYFTKRSPSMILDKSDSNLVAEL